MVCEDNLLTLPVLGMAANAQAQNEVNRNVARFREHI